MYVGRGDQVFENSVVFSLTYMDLYQLKDMHYPSSTYKCKPYDWYGHISMSLLIEAWFNVV